MGLLNWIARKIKGTDFLENVYESTEDREVKIRVQEYAVYVVTEMIASIVSNIEFKTYGKGAKETRSDMWTRLNLHPNTNQNATEFWMELTSRLLIEGEALIVQVNDQLIIADSFVRYRNACNRWLSIVSYDKKYGRNQEDSCDFVNCVGK